MVEETEGIHSFYYVNRAAKYGEHIFVKNINNFRVYLSNFPVSPDY